jgi:tetratricopeptide (TPR) repeat protein
MPGEMRCGFRPPPAHAFMTMRFLALILVLCAAAPAAAQTPPTEPRPWADGVPDAEQQIALAAYEQGNAEYAESRFAQALALYREAIAHWDHPAIRFNMAVCLINLGQPIEAREALERALAYGEAPLGADVHKQALTYRALLDGQLTRVTIHSAEVHALVTLDGTVLFEAPGSFSAWLKPGEHQVVATKTGYLTYSEPLSLVAGTTRDIDVRLLPFTSTTRTTRRWQPWKPYAVIATGAVVAGGGALIYTLAARDYDRYDDAIRAACPRGCTAAETAALTNERAIKDSADFKQSAAVSLLVVGGAIAVSGGVGLYLNQPRTEVVAPPVTPGVIAGPGGLMVTLGGGF